MPAPSLSNAAFEATRAAGLWDEVKTLDAAAAIAAVREHFNWHNRSFELGGARLNIRWARRRSSAASFSVPSAAQTSGRLGWIGTSTRSAARTATRASVSRCGGLSISTKSYSDRTVSTRFSR